MQTITERQIINKIRPQRQVVLERLNKVGAISNSYAKQELHIKNLAEIIRRIKKMDIDIETTALDSDVVYELTVLG